MGEVRRRKRQGLLDVAQRCVNVLAGQAVHEIDVEIGEAGGVQLRRGAPCLCRASECGPAPPAAHRRRICAPSETRLTPAARYSANRPRSMVPGFASRVTSRSAASIESAVVLESSSARWRAVKTGSAYRHRKKCC